MRLCIDVILGVNFITSGVLDAVSLLFMLIVDKRKRREKRVRQDEAERTSRGGKTKKRRYQER